MIGNLKHLMSRLPFYLESWMKRSTWINLKVSWLKARSLRSVTYRKPFTAWSKLHFSEISSSTRVSWRWISSVYFQTQELQNYWSRHNHPFSLCWWCSFCYVNHDDNNWHFCANLSETTKCFDPPKGLAEAAYWWEIKEGGETNRSRVLFKRWSFWGNSKRTWLKFSGGDFGLYILLILFVHDCIGSTDTVCIRWTLNPGCGN